MTDDTSGIIGWPIGQQYRDMAARDEASTTTWETLVEQYRERAARDDARIDELMQRANHWHDVADMLKRQRDMAEQERDALRKDAARLNYLADKPVFEGFADSPFDIGIEYVVAEQNGRSEPTQSDRREAFRRVIDAAMGVQP